MEKNLAVYTICRNFAENIAIMKRLYRNISFALFAVVSATASAAAPAFMSPYDPWQIEVSAPAVEEIQSEEVTIKAEGRKITVSGATDETLEVYNIAGVKVASYPIDAPEKTVTLNVGRGVYILRVGKVARKVNIV